MARALKETDLSTDTRVWIFNPGSATIKWDCFPSLDALAPETRGRAGMNEFRERMAGLARNTDGLAVVRFVHGGADFVRPVVVAREDLPRLQALRELAPLHNQASLDCIERLLEGTALRVVAVFDTEFFHDLPEVARLYGLPRALLEKYRIRRFGFHGFAHAGMVGAWEGLDRPDDDGQARGEYRLVTLQLGSGCSMAAIRGGRPVETSMGFTPNEGLLMSTRCGDLDPGLLTWLQRREGWSPEQTDACLNQQSGWLGLSGESANLGDLLVSDSEDAARALALFAHRVRKTLGAYFALLGGLDGIMFSGGVAEYAPDFCRRLLEGLEHLGIRPGPAPARSPQDDAPLRLTEPDSPVSCWVVAGQEHRAMLKRLAVAAQSA